MKASGMMKTPNWLDLEKGLAVLYWQIELFNQAEAAQINYDDATSFCTSCPGPDVSGPGGCCRNLPGEQSESVWEDQFVSDYQGMRDRTAIKEAILKVVSPEALDAARKAE
jgi:hypothetical protein